MCFVVTWWPPEYQMDAAGQVHAGWISSQDCELQRMLEDKKQIKIAYHLQSSTHGSTGNGGPYVGQTMLHFQVSLTREIGVIRF